jgi:subfamily B ATP-binding cassette protein MsbA
MKVLFGAGVICGVINGAISGIGFPLMVTKVFPVVFSDPKPSMAILVASIALLPTIMLIRGVTQFFNTFFMSLCGMKLLIEIRLKIQRKLESLPIAFFHKNDNGDIFSRILYDTFAFQVAIIQSSIDLIKQPVQFLGAVGTLVYLSLQQKQMVFLLLFVGIIPAVVVPMRVIGKRLLRRAGEVQEEMANISQSVSEDIDGAREVRAFNLQPRQYDKFTSVLDNYCRVFMKTVKYGNIMRPSIEFVSSIGIAAAVGYLIVSDIHWGEVSALFIALYMTYEPIKKFGEVYNILKKGEAALDRLDYILDEVDVVPDAQDPYIPNEVNGVVQLKNVYFKYLEDWVLEDINLEVPAGSVIALVGHSGAGKSTLADLIPRFYDVNQGAIEIDGIDVKKYSKTALRNAVSVVSQDTFLFNTSIEENIRLGRLDADDEEIRIAAKNAFAHEFIEEIEDGYKTVVGDRGVRLSGGQKQRIAIARAFLKNAPILILDEATSALDTESEEKIQIALEQLVHDKTVFVIAHRFSTIRNADKIVVLDAGKMVGYGSHDELYADNEVYKRLYDRQFSD